MQDWLYTPSAAAGAHADARRQSAYQIDKAVNEPEEDDYLHEAAPPAKVWGESRYLVEARSFRGTAFWSSRGCLNVGVVACLLTALIGLFGVWPVADFVYSTAFTNTTGYFAGSPTGSGISGTGDQISGMTNVPPIFQRTGPVDPDTPSDALKKVNFDGVEMELVCECHSSL